MTFLNVVGFNLVARIEFSGVILDWEIIDYLIFHSLSMLIFQVIVIYTNQLL